MSRTYRKQLDWRYHVHGNYYNWRDVSNGYMYRRSWCGEHYINRKARDNKPRGKPPKWFKQMKRRIERAINKNEMCNNREITHFSKTDSWDWT